MRSLFNFGAIIGFFIACFVLVFASSRVSSAEWLGLSCCLAFTGMLILKSLRDDRRDATL